MNTFAIAQTVLYYSPRCQPAWLFGPRHKSARIAIIQAITGTKPKASECGITRMMVLLFQAFPVAITPDSCLYSREAELAELIKTARQ